jgi:hypothetical protein
MTTVIDYYYYFYYCYYYYYYYYYKPAPFVRFDAVLRTSINEVFSYNCTKSTSLAEEGFVFFPISFTTDYSIVMNIYKYKYFTFFTGVFALLLVATFEFLTISKVS